MEKGLSMKSKIGGLGGFGENPFENPDVMKRISDLEWELWKLKSNIQELEWSEKHWVEWRKSLQMEVE